MNKIAVRKKRQTAPWRNARRKHKARITHALKDVWESYINKCDKNPMYKTPVHIPLIFVYSEKGPG